MAEFLTTMAGRRIAYHQTAGQGPGVVFLGGFMSDMTGTKAIHLENWAKANGRAFLRFDYSGHGESSGEFRDGCIGDWADDAAQALINLTTGPQILVGSSMGGWIGLLLARLMPERIAGFVGIAAAPDFTEDGFWAGFDEGQRAQVMNDGLILIPSDFGAPYPITRRMIEDGRENLILKQPLALPFPTRLLQGTADEEVSQDVATQLLSHAQGDDISLTLVKGADHRFSSEICLSMVENAVDEVTIVATT